MPPLSTPQPFEKGWQNFSFAEWNPRKIRNAPCDQNARGERRPRYHPSSVPVSPAPSAASNKASADNAAAASVPCTCSERRLRDELSTTGSLPAHTCRRLSGCCPVVFFPSLSFGFLNSIRDIYLSLIISTGPVPCQALISSPSLPVCSRNKSAAASRA